MFVCKPHYTNYDCDCMVGMDNIGTLACEDTMVTMIIELTVSTYIENCLQICINFP